MLEVFSAPSMMPVSVATISSDTALPRSGWFKVMRRIAPSCSFRMSGMVAPHEYDRHPEVPAEGGPRRMHGPGRRPSEIGLARFRISAVQVGNSRLGWLAALAPQGDGRESSVRFRGLDGAPDAF